MAEAAIVVAVVGWFVAPNIKELMDWARSDVVKRYKWSRGFQKKLLDLAVALEEINDVVGAASAGFVNDRARIGRLWRIKDAIHDAEELLDRFQYEILEANLRNLENRGKQKIGSRESRKELEELLGRLDELRESSRDLLQASQSGVRPIPRLITGPLPIKDKIFGYDKEYTDLLSRLSGGDAGVVAIIGHAGTGKTALARRAFHDQKIVRAKFDLCIWVCVYGKFTETELLREIWKSAFRLGPVGEMNVTCLQLALTLMVKSARRYLLVLDDVCNDESAAASELGRWKTWDTVLAPFKQHGGRGSRILMTSRAEICATTLGAGAHIVLNGIDNHSSMMLLKKTAFGDEHAQLPRELQEVLDCNVGKLHGSPLAAEEVGFTLKDKICPANLDEGIKCNRINKWREIMNKDLHKNVYKAHLSSYQDLSPQLQRCFAICSIFPKKWRFEPEKLIMMWIALGFVQGPSEFGEKTTEDVARGYFDALRQRSLFQEAATVKDKSGVSYYVINDHIHSMLRLVCPKYYLTIDGSHGKSPIPLTVRHLSVTTSCLDQLKGYPDGLKKLRTLLVFNDDYASSSSASALVSVLKKFKGVRVLDFSDTFIDEMPEGIGELKHLRYLGLPNTISNLGARVPKLLLLQTLYLKYIAKMGGIGRLDKLQGSVEFHAGKSEEGHGMGELEKLNSLRRMLSIKGLEIVGGKQEAQSAQLDKKEHLKVLKLQWEHRSQQQAKTSDSTVIEGLQPHPNLEKLHITRYLGTTSPTWLADPSVLGNLRSLYLRNCRELKDLPLLGGLPRLELLNIKELSSVERIDHRFCGSGAFESLEKMVLDDMPRLVSWDAEPCGDGIYTPILFPRLKEVKIINCPRLSSLSGLLCCRYSLSHLHVERCRDVTTTFCRSSFPSLTELDTLGCPGLHFEESPDQGDVRTWALLFILVLLCIYYKIKKHLFVTTILQNL
ncbi:putative disease resistance protein RGA3 [Phragmites australis]|uniref:putative disease resistance protein RGA3 n=1 Tax=Phragmites australis TaxID=29695 RepID=UPI002D769199|nr:putative disease resistance protein RGA3 [Phragmites australis]XP_062197004.1 putative disease resistance protein RGA3 [Phragmites australis]